MRQRLIKVGLVATLVISSGGCGGGATIGDFEYQFAPDTWQPSDLIGTIWSTPCTGADGEYHQNILVFGAFTLPSPYAEIVDGEITVLEGGHVSSDCSDVATGTPVPGIYKIRRIPGRADLARAIDISLSPTPTTSTTIYDLISIVGTSLYRGDYSTGDASLLQLRPAALNMNLVWTKQ